jgi:transcription elongation factor S-II
MGDADAETPTGKNDDDVRRFVAQAIVERTKLSAAQAKDAEVGVFNWAVAKADERKVAKNWRNPRFRSIYEARARSVVANLDPSSYIGNLRLASRLEEREFQPHDVAFMTNDHVFPERWKHVLDLKLQRDEYITNAQPAAMTDMFKCGRCKKRQCQYQSMQIRSSDEPSTIFVQCLVCSNRWRIG